jgi:hypothetical protein
MVEEKQTTTSVQPMKYTSELDIDKEPGDYKARPGIDIYV